MAGYVGYQAKTAAEFEEYVNSIGVSSVDDMTDENIAKLQEFYAGSPNLVFFRVMGVRGDRDLDEIKKKMFDTPILVCDEIGTAGVKVSMKNSAIRIIRRISLRRRTSFGRRPRLQAISKTGSRSKSLRRFTLILRMEPLYLLKHRIWREIRSLPRNCSPATRSL